MSNNVLLSPLPSSLTTKKITPSKSNQTPSLSLKAPSRKCMRRSFTPNGLNHAASPTYTPIGKSSILETSQDFLNGSMTPNNTSLDNSIFNSINRNIFFTPQQVIGKNFEVNKTFTVRGNKGMKKKVDGNGRASIRRSLNMSMNSPLAITSSKPLKYPFSPVEFDERPPTPMPMHGDAHHSSHGSTFIANILDHTMDIAFALKEFGLDKYIEKFEREEIDLFVFSMLNSDDLIELGIDEDDRPAFLRAFDTYRDIFGNVDIFNC